MTIRREGITITSDVTQVLRDNIAVIPIEDPDRTDSGLYIPDEAKQRADNGVVKFIGPEVKEVSVGDHVLFSGYAGTKVTISGIGVLIIMPEGAVVAKLPDEPTRWMTDKQVLRLIEEAEGETLSRMAPASNSQWEKDIRNWIKKSFAVMQTKVTDFDFDKGFEF